MAARSALLTHRRYLCLSTLRRRRRTHASQVLPTTIHGEIDPFGHTGQAEDYDLARPRYPGSLLQRLLPLGPPHPGGSLMIDVGCGTGQIAVPMAKHFDRVLGIDRSIKQLRVAEAGRPQNVEYHAGSAYDLPAATGTVDLVTIGQALHWLAMPRFFGEVKRVLKPEGGKLAVLGYAVPRLEDPQAEDPQLQNCFASYYVNVLGSTREPGESGCYWDISRPLLDSGFASTEFPFREVQPTHWEPVTQTATLDGFMTYLSTMSAYRTLLASGVQDPLLELREQLRNSAPGELLTVTVPFFLIQCTV